MKQNYSNTEKNKIKKNPTNSLRSRSRFQDLHFLQI